MGEAREIPTFDLMAELKPNGWVRLGRMEPVILGKGSVLAVPALVETPIAAESHEDGGCGVQWQLSVHQVSATPAHPGGGQGAGYTHKPEEPLHKRGWRTDPTGNDSWTVRKHPWL